MRDMIIRNTVEDDFKSILGLNDYEVMQTSPMDINRLRQLHAMASYHKVATEDGQVAAFLLAMREGAPYQNDNYEWFASRYKLFLYVDRVVVGSAFSGLGIGSLLYKDLFAHARSHAIPIIACEYNIEPPNLASRAFHDKFGFKEVGRQHVAQGAKLVSLQIVET